MMYSNQSNGPLVTYEPTTQDLDWYSDVASFNTNRLGAVNRDDSWLAYERSSGAVTISPYRVSGSPRTLRGLQGGIGFNPVLDVFYGVDVVSDQVIAYETDTLTEIARYSIGENAIDAAPYANGIMSFSGDGRLLFLSTPSGVRMLNLVP